MSEPPQAPRSEEPGAPVRRRRLRISVALAAGLLMAGGSAGAALWLRGDRAPIESRPALPPPNIVVVLTDDQRWDTLWAMPVVTRELAGRGVVFANSFVIDPVCCPSRASTLTGRYPHSTGVWRNHAPFGGFPVFDDHSTVATWLKEAGYTTALFGKYLNRYRGTTYIPPGWDRWMAFNGSVYEGNFYFDYLLNVDGVVQRHGHRPRDYSTDVLGAAAVSFIERTPGRVFMLFAPPSPHGPGTPAAADAHAFDGLLPWRPVSYNEADVSDKPRWARALPPLTSAERAEVERKRRDGLGSLRSVDRWIGRMIQALDATGRLRDTVFVFTSDNGLSWGEHRWIRKVAPWEENIRVPLVVRYDRLVGGPGRRDHHLVLNVDLAPTFAELAGTGAPGVEGASLVPLLAGSATSWRRDFGVESMGTERGPEVPSYCAVRTERYMLVHYVTGELELYDLRRDPFQLENVASDPANAPLVERLRARIRASCRPPPPLSPAGFPW